MKHVIALVVVSAVLTATFVFGADAQRRRDAPRQNAVPESNVLAADMAGIEWGWSRRQLMDHFRAQLRARYAPRLSKAPGAIEEDSIRAEMERELRRLQESYFEFDGAPSGFDAGFLRLEFTHNNHEAMVRSRNETSEDYYFFINDHLWKRYRAFHASVFAGASFDQFAAALEERYGRARRQSGVLYEGQSETQWIEWQNHDTRARAIDNTQFYGFYCLVFEERATVARLTELRPNQPERRRHHHALVEAVVIDPNSEGEVYDPHANVVDRITAGQIGAPGMRSGASSSAQSAH